MKKLITILTIVSLPVMGMSIDDAKDKLTQYGIAIPTVMVDTAVYSGSSNKTAITDWILNGFAGDNNFIVQQGSSEFYESGMNNGNGWGDGIRNRDSTFQHITASGLVFGRFRVNTNNAVTGANAYKWYVDGLRSANADLFYESEDVMGEVNNRIGSVILDKANSVKPIVENIGRQIAASALGKEARAACANQVEFTLVDPLCTAIGSKFSDIANDIEPYSGIISEDNVVYQGMTWYRDFDAVPWWGSTDADTRLGIYRLRNADGSWRMETRATGSYIRGWNEANTDTGHGWSPEVNYATLYDDDLNTIGDLADVLITLDGETFGDIF